MDRIECVQLHHVNIVVGDLDAARAFYCDLLGLTEVPRPQLSTDGFWIQIDDAQIHVALGDEPAPRRHHFALEVTNIEDAIRYLEAEGLDVRRFPVVEGAGRQAALRDPSGNLVEIRQSA